MKKALIVGIDHYEFAPLSACIKDARDISALLEKHDNGEPNFHCKLLLSSKTEDPDKMISEKKLKKSIKELLSGPVETALFYFSGHGKETDLGGYLVTQDASNYDEGVSFMELIQMANASKIKRIIIILDCCHAGGAGNQMSNINLNRIANLKEGLSILSASTPNQYAVEKRNQNGLFTSIMLNALRGGAADVKGEVTVASLYDYADQLLGPWDQRPMFKSHVTELFPIRKCKPKVRKEELRLMIEFFPTPDAEYPLDPSYEFTAEPKNKEHESIFSILQNFTSAGLVEPVGAEHMYFAAMENKSCRLTPLGKFYWNMIDKKRL